MIISIRSKVLVKLFPCSAPIPSTPFCQYFSTQIRIYTFAQNEANRTTRPGLEYKARTNSEEVPSPVRRQQQ